MGADNITLLHGALLFFFCLFLLVSLFPWVVPFVFVSSPFPLVSFFYLFDCLAHSSSFSLSFSFILSFLHSPFLSFRLPHDFPLLLLYLSQSAMPIHSQAFKFHACSSTFDNGNSISSPTRRSIEEYLGRYQKVLKQSLWMTLRERCDIITYTLTSFTPKDCS